ncbi:hypothetical protein GPJ56_008954 [Histomonas meleagridis]|uniref:uncharacterized protein n=1 Tax=Histomonas meleagridis TaxID=135588 RepID=UPI003559DCEE|nr:hypothetical protein GPJ56_008954 [Histomonas meleagridis]KAH0805691.1 hypothetical protein GO595_001532 [Histomonas meleagridis]
MMKIHLIDFEDLDIEIEIEEGTTTMQLLCYIHDNFGIDVSHSFLIRNGIELEFNEKLTQEMFADDNSLVVFHRKVFPEKSFPKVNRCFNFKDTKYHEYFQPPKYYSNDNNNNDLLTLSENPFEQFRQLVNRLRINDPSSSSGSESSSSADDENLEDSSSDENDENAETSRNYSQQEREDIEYLVRLGYAPRSLTIQVYETVGRNVEIAEGVLNGYDRDGEIDYQYAFLS